MITKIRNKTFAQCAPNEFLLEYDDTQAYKMKDIKVIAKYDDEPWPGNHKYVFVWWELENGYGVALNENPASGLSFPVIKLKKEI